MGSCYTSGMYRVRRPPAAPPVPAHARASAVLLRWLAKFPRPRCSLQSLVLLVLVAGSASVLWLHRNPWYLERSFSTLGGYPETYTVSNDGQFLAVWPLGSAIRVFNLNTGAQTSSFDAKGAWVNGIEFSPDGQRLGWEEDDYMKFRVMNVQTGKVEAERVLFPVKILKPRCIAVHNSRYPPSYPPSRIFHLSMANEPVIGDGGSLFCLADGKVVADKPGNFLAFSPQGTFSLYMKSKTSWRAVRTETGDVASEIQAGPTWYPIAAFLDETRCCLLDTMKGTVWFWNLETGEVQAQVAPNPGHASYAWSIGSQDRLLVGGEEGLCLWTFPMAGPIPKPVVLPTSGRLRHYPCRNALKMLSVQLPETKPEIRYGISSAKLFGLEPWKELAEFVLPDNEYADGAEFIDEDTLLILSHKGKAFLFKRRFEESPLGMVFLPEAWLAGLFALLLVWSLVRDFRTLRRTPA